MQKLRRGAGGIHGGEETGPTAVLDILHSLHSSCHNLVMALLNSMSYLDVGGGNEDMHHAYIGIKAGLSITFYNAGEAADLGLQAGLGDLPDAVKLAFGGYGKSSLDDIHTEFVKLPGNLELLILGE